MTVNNETCLFSGARPMLAWSLHEKGRGRPSHRFLLAVQALRNLGAEVGAPIGNSASHEWEWSAGVRVFALPGSELALAVGGLLKRLDPECYGGQAFGARAEAAL